MYYLSPLLLYVLELIVPFSGKTFLCMLETIVTICDYID